MAESLMGLVGPDQWSEEHNPKSWRQQAFKLHPNGRFPLTALTSLAPGQPIPNFHHLFPVEDPYVGGGALTADEIYTDDGMTAKYVSGGVAGQPLFIKTTQQNASIVRKDHEITLLCSTDSTLTCNVLVVASEKNGASSKITVVLSEADDNGVGSIATADYMLNTGTKHAQGSAWPQALLQMPSWITTFSRIFWNTLEVSGTVEEIKTRLGPREFIRRQNLALEYHNTEIEEALFYSTRDPAEPDNNGGWTFSFDEFGKPRTSFMGLFDYLKRYLPTAFRDYRTDTDYAGKTWLVGGKDWLDAQIQDLFLYGDSKRLGMCGAGVMTGINKLVASYGDVKVTSSTREFGFQVTDWITAHGEIPMKTAPLFSQHAPRTHQLVILNPRRSVKIRHEVNRDTKFKNAPNNFDGKMAGFLSELTVEYGPAQEMMVLDGVGCDNPL